MAGRTPGGPEAARLERELLRTVLARCGAGRHRPDPRPEPALRSPPRTGQTLRGGRCGPHLASYTRHTRYSTPAPYRPTSPSPWLQQRADLTGVTHLGLRAGPEGHTNPRVHRVGAVVKFQQGTGDLVGAARGDVLAGDGGLLRVGGFHGGRRDLLGAANLAGSEPARQARTSACSGRGWYPVSRTRAPRLPEPSNSLLSAESSH